MVARDVHRFKHGKRMPKKVLLLVAKLAVTAALLYFVFRNLSFEEIAQQLSEFAPGPFLLAMVLVAVQGIVVVAWRWGQILTAIDRPIGLKELAGPTIIAIFFNQVLPSTVGGDGMRIWLLSRMDRPLGLAVRSILWDRLLGMLGLMILSGLGALALLPFVDNTAPLLGTAAVALIGAAVIVASPAFLNLVRFIPIVVVRQQLETVASEVRTLKGKGTLLINLISVSIAGHVLICLSVCALAASLELDVPLLATFAILPAVFLATAIPISIAGWGVREGAMVLGLGLVGVGAEPAALMSVSFGLLQLGFGLLGGLVWLVYGRPKPAHRLAG